MTRNAYVVLVVMTDLKGFAGPMTLHNGAGSPPLAIAGIAPVYLERADAVRDWPGAVIVPVTMTFPDHTGGAS